MGNDRFTMLVFFLRFTLLQVLKIIRICIFYIKKRPRTVNILQCLVVKSRFIRAYTRYAKNSQIFFIDTRNWEYPLKTRLAPCLVTIRFTLQKSFLKKEEAISEFFNILIVSSINANFDADVWKTMKNFQYLANHVDY